MNVGGNHDKATDDGLYLKQLKNRYIEAIQKGKTIILNEF
jgi:hypothetical protein